MHQKPTNTKMQDSGVLSRIVNANPVVCSFCGKKMVSKNGFFYDLECENGHIAGKLADDGTPIKATFVKETPQ